MSNVPTTDDRLRSGDITFWGIAVSACVTCALFMIEPVHLISIAVADETKPVAKEPSGKAADQAPDNQGDQQQANKRSSLTGTIIDDVGAPVDDAELTLSVREGGRDMVVLSTTTDEEGKYLFEEVPKKADYFLAIKSNRCLGLIQRNEQLALSLDPKSTLVKNLTLQRACRIKIRALDEENSQPVPDVSIYFVLSTEARPRYNQHFATDKEGWVEIVCPKAAGAKYIFGAMHNQFALEQITQELDDPGRVPRRTIFMRKGTTMVGQAVCSDGKPPRGWRISALPSWWNFGVYPSGAVIDDEGLFRLEHVVPGKYNVSISVPIGKSGSSPKRVLVDTDLIEKGEPLEIKMDYPSPSSLVYIKGRVTIDDDFPKTEGFWIHANSVTGNDHTGEFIRSGNEEFSLGPIPKGVYRFDISHPKLEPVTLKNVEAPADDLKIELHTRKKIMLRGTVSDLQTGKPIDGFSVRVTRLRSLDRTTYQQDDGWKSVSDPQGAFALEMTGHGVYEVKAIANGFGPATSEPINTIEQRNHMLSLKLKPGVTLNGLILDERGNPISGATVTALSMAALETTSTNDSSGFPVASVTSVAGRFAFANMAEGREILRVSHPDFCSTIARDVEVKPGSTDPVKITLTQGATVSGCVYDEAGSPMPNVAIHFHHGAGYEFAYRSESQFASVVTDKKGNYQVQHLPSQLIYITRSPSSEAQGVVRRSVLAANGKTHSIDLGGPSRLTGRVQMNGEPLADKRIQLGSDHPWIGIMQSYAQTSADGAFEFRGAVPGKWKLYAQRAQNDWIRLSEIVVPANGAGELGTIDLKMGRITVTFDSLPPEMANNVHMQLTDFDPVWANGTAIARPSHRNMITDPFMFDSVQTGDYVISCYWENHLQTFQRLTVTPENLNSTVAIKLPIGTASIVGTVDQDICRRDGDEALKLWSTDLRFLGHISPKSDGTFELKDLPAGDYDIRDKDTRTAPVIFSFKLGDGEIKTLELTPSNTTKSVLKDGFLFVTVYNRDGAPIPCDVELTGAEGRLKPTSVQAERSGFSGPPGMYELVVTLPGFKPVKRQVEMHAFNLDENSSPKYELTIYLEPDEK